MNVVITMAGRGRRFAEAGFTRPKPMIDVLGVPMYARSTSSLPLHLASRLVFVCLREQLETYPLDDDIRSRFGKDAVVVALDDVTEGQACTVLAAAGVLEPGLPLVVHNADTIFRSDLEGTMRRHPSASGLLGVFRAEGDHWSFARTDRNGVVTETAEKQRISDWASTGLYVFKSAELFVDAAEKALAEDDRGRGEFYIAPLYNRLISAGLEVRMDIADEVWPLGTPAELDIYLRHGR